MILIIGGAGQGKTDFAKTVLHQTELQSGAECPLPALMRASCITDYHLLVRRLMAEGTAPLAFTEQLLAQDPEVVVILNEIGCGIIPVEETERRWREETGRCGCLLAERAKAVVRLCCGIPTLLRGSL